MSDNELMIARFLHEARIALFNAQHNIDQPLTEVDEALHLVETALEDNRFYLSVMTDAAWIGCDGMYVDYGTFDGQVDGGERLSHFVWPLPVSENDLNFVLADIAEALPDQAYEE